MEQTTQLRTALARKTAESGFWQQRAGELELQLIEAEATILRQQQEFSAALTKEGARRKPADKAKAGGRAVP